MSLATVVSPITVVARRDKDQLIHGLFEILFHPHRPPTKGSLVEVSASQPSPVQLVKLPFMSIAPEGAEERYKGAGGQRQGRVPDAGGEPGNLWFPPDPKDGSPLRGYLGMKEGAGQVGPRACIFGPAHWRAGRVGRSEAGLDLFELGQLLLALRQVDSGSVRGSGRRWARGCP